MTAPPDSRTAGMNEIAAAKERLEDMRREVMRVYIGSPRVADLLLTALLARGHVLLEGVPGIAKTTLAKAFSAALGCSMRRIQFTPDLLPADITGTYVLSPREGTFSLRPGPVFANVVLADEINRAPAKTQSALLEAMQEQQVTIEGDRFELPKPFLVVATQNPIDLEGTYPLPEAQIDRFLIRVPVGYPTHKDEVAMLRAHNVTAPQASAVLSSDDVQALQSIAARVHVEDDLFEYAVSLTGFTRAHPRLALGASPRASLGLLQAAKGAAVIDGRNYVTPDDIRALAGPVLAHRFILVPEVEGDEKVRDHVVEEALSKVSYRRAVRAV
jgi:MoxR-like ATPase